jgi:hypothetical protein
MIRNVLVALIGALITACASSPDTAGTAEESLASATVAAGSGEHAPVIELASLPNAAEQDVVCVAETKPGSRIVIGERCYAREESGINVETREYIQREIAGGGSSPGWKTEQQIQLERGISLGLPVPPR